MPKPPPPRPIPLPPLPPRPPPDPILIPVPLPIIDPPFPAPTKDAQYRRDLLHASGCRLLKGSTGKVIYKLLDEGRLHIFYDGIHPEEYAELALMRTAGVFVEYHQSKSGPSGRGIWIGTGGPHFTQYFQNIKGKYAPSLCRYVTRLTKMFNASVDTEFMKAYPDKIWSEEDIVGFQGLHTDNFLADLRAMKTLGGKHWRDPNVKTMTFLDIKTMETDTITMPHGHVIVMDRIAAGAVKDPEYKHGVNNTEDTVAFGVELNSKAHNDMA